MPQTILTLTLYSSIDIFVLKFKLGIVENIIFAKISYQ
jgi:hypothetical protein